MTPTPQFDGPRLMNPGEERASARLSQICFNDLSPVEPQEDAVAPAPGEAAPAVRRKAAPRLGDEETWLIAGGGQPVSQINIYQETLRGFDLRLRTGCIGGVCTHPDSRGHGLASLLLERCAARLKEGGARLMVISGGRGLYLRAGAVPCGQYATFNLRSEMVGSLPAAPGGEVALKLFCEDGQEEVADSRLWAASAIYQGEPFHFTRKFTDYAHHFARHNSRFHAEEWLVERGGSPAASLLLNIPWEHLNEPFGAGIREVFEYAGSRAALVSALCAALALPGMREIILYAPWQDAGLIELLKGCGAAPRWQPLEGHTMRLLDFRGLLADLRPYLQARLAPGLLRGLRFEQSGPLVAGTDQGPGRCAIRRGRDHLELDTAAMTALVMGACDAGEPAPLPALPGALAEIIPAIFPLPSFLPGLNYH